MSCSHATRAYEEKPKSHVHIAIGKKQIQMRQAGGTGEVARTVEVGLVSIALSAGKTGRKAGGAGRVQGQQGRQTKQARQDRQGWFLL